MTVRVRLSRALTSTFKWQDREFETEAFVTFRSPEDATDLALALARILAPEITAAIVIDLDPTREAEEATVITLAPALDPETATPPDVAALPIDPPDVIVRPLIMIVLLPALLVAPLLRPQRMFPLLLLLLMPRQRHNHCSHLIRG